MDSGNSVRDIARDPKVYEGTLRCRLSCLAAGLEDGRRSKRETGNGLGVIEAWTARQPWESEGPERACGVWSWWTRLGLDTER